MSSHALSNGHRDGRDVGTGLPLPAIIAVGVALVMLLTSAVVLVSLRGGDEARHLAIATGPESGTYHALGKAIAGVLENEEVVATADVRSTAGSVTNMELVGGDQRRVDLAFVQSDTRPSPGARLIAPLYQETLHILVANEASPEITSVEHLAGRRVSLGPVGSGTRHVAERVLEHFRVMPAEDFALGPSEVVGGLLDGTVEAAFILSAIPSRTVDRLCQGDSVRFLSLGDAQEHGNAADGLALVYPSLRSTVIPRSTYDSAPRAPVSTVMVSALLVASDRLDRALVRTITQTIFESRSQLVGSGDERLVVARRIREAYQPDTTAIPYHDGAVAFYHRAKPPFVVRYAETMSLILTVFVGLCSVWVAFRQWMRRRMKNRIDVYYLEVEKLATDIKGDSLDQLTAHRKALHRLQRRAFSDLVAERLEANASFTIFQDYLRSEVETLETRIAEASTAD